MVSFQEWNETASQYYTTSEMRVAWIVFGVIALVFLIGFLVYKIRNRKVNQFEA